MPARDATPPIYAPRSHERLPEASARIPFAGARALNRMSERRDDAGYIGSLLQHENALSLLFVGELPVVAVRDGRHHPWFTPSEAASLGSINSASLLGIVAQGPRFVTALPETAAVADGALDAAAIIHKQTMRIPARPDLLVLDLRSLALAGQVHGDDLGMLGQAKSLLHWHARNRFCPSCGNATSLASAGWRLECAACKVQQFPRTDPVVIMLATHEDSCLMGRQSRFPPGMYSALAGFLEPGETIEQAVRRELKEEAGIETGEVAYFATQPWPFPASLMIGCFASALDRELVVDRSELEDARWFSREEAAKMLSGEHKLGFTAPQPLAIAHHLLKKWLS